MRAAAARRPGPAALEPGQSAGKRLSMMIMIILFIAHHRHMMQGRDPTGTLPLNVTRMQYNVASNQCDLALIVQHLPDSQERARAAALISAIKGRYRLQGESPELHGQWKSFLSGLSVIIPAPAILFNHLEDELNILKELRQATRD